MTAPTDCQRTRSRILAAGALLALLAVAVTGATPGLAAPKRVGAAAAKPKRPYTTLPQRTSLRALFAAAGDAQPPTSPSHLSTKASSQSSITLGWHASRDNVAVAGYGTYVDGLRVGSTKAKPPSFQFARLSCGRTYGLGVDAYDTAGNRSRTASVLSATAPCVDTAPPTAPAGLRQTGTGQIGVTIEWNGSTDDVGVAGYRVYREGVPVGVTQQQSLWLGGLVCGAGYAVSVEAFDAAGNRSPRAQLVVTTTACPTDTPPSAPSELVVTDASTTSVTVSWRAASDDFGVAGYRTSIDGASAGTTTATVKTFAGLACGRSYLVELVAVDAGGGASPPASLNATTRSCDGSTGGSTPPSIPGGDTQAPSAPAGIAQVTRTETSITLTWQLATDNVGVAGYRIYRDGAQIGTALAPPYAATGLACGRSYTFSIEAYDAAGNHSTRPATMLTTSACSDTTAPSAPGSLRQTGSTASSVSVSWDAAADNTGVAGYTLFVGGPAAGTTAQTSYSFPGLACGTSYTIAVEAFDAAGNRSPRVSLSATTAACGAAPAPPPTGSVYVTPGGSDANPCTQASPCRTFGRAYKAASAGATVVVGAGTYPGQEIDEDPSKPASGAPVVFEPSGPVVVDGTLDFGQDQFDRAGPKGVTIRNMKITYLHAWPGSDRLTWENIDAVHFDLDATNSTIRGGDFGPCQAPRDDPSCLSRVLGSSRNVLIENSSFHDITSTDLGRYHVDGMAVFGGENITLRSNRFYANMITNIRVQNCCGNLPIRNLVLENNTFARPLQGDGVSTNANGIDIDSSVPGLKIRFNSFAEGSYPQILAAQTDAQLTANLLTHVSCVSGVSYAYNVFKPWSEVQGQTGCSPTDRKTSSLGYSSGSFTLVAGATAVDYVPTTVGCPGVDLAGTARPTGSGCDAGAYERQ